MIKIIFRLGWSYAFLMFFVCCFFYFTINYKQECKHILKNVEKYFVESAEKHSWDLALAKKSMKRLIMSASRNNIVFLLTFVYLGGVGSVFWFLVAGLMAALLKFIREIILHDSNADKTTAEHIDEELKKRMHFKRTKAVKVIFLISTIIYCVFFIPQYYSVKLITDCYGFDEKTVILIFSMSLAILFLNKKSWNGNLYMGISTVLLVVYTLTIFALLLGNWGTIIQAYSAIITDAFQLKYFLGGMVGHGLFQCIQIGVSAGISSSGIIFEGNSQKLNSNMEVGIWAFVETVFEVIFIGFNTGVIIVIAELSKVTMDTGSIAEIMNEIFPSATVATIFIALTVYFTLIGSCMQIEYILNYVSNPKINKFIQYGYPIFVFFYLWVLNQASFSLKTIYEIWTILLVIPVFMQLMVMISRSEVFNQIIEAELKSN